MQLEQISPISTDLERAIAIVMEENGCDTDAATCGLAGSAVSQRLTMDEVAAAVVAMAYGSSLAS